jgi:hypothetical protein
MNEYKIEKLGDATYVVYRKERKEMDWPWTRSVWIKVNSFHNEFEAENYVRQLAAANSSKKVQSVSYYDEFGHKDYRNHV